MNISQKLARPSEAEAKALGKLFPSSASAGKKRTRPFDPTNECGVAREQKKKAANSQGRVTNVQAVLLKSFIPSLPRGKRRTELKDSGLIQTVQFKRSMTPLEVKNQIIRAFQHTEDLQAWMYLDNSDNHLLVSKKQELDGEDVIKRKGSLYLCLKSRSEVRSNFKLS